MNLARPIDVDLSGFNAALREYRAARRMTTEQVVLKQASELAWELYHQSKEIAPPRGQVLREAIARGWRMGRKGDSLTPATGGISTSAVKHAEEMLAGRKSDYFAIRYAAGIPVITRVRFSGMKGKRAGRRLLGGRFGTRFAASALRAHQVSKERLAQEAAFDDRLRPLNTRSLAVAIEARRRTIGRGVSAVQWLPKVWRKRRSAVAKGGGLVANTFGGRPIGRVEMDQQDGRVQSVNLIGQVPGTDRVFRRHNILAKALAARAADMLTYVRNKESEAARKAGLA